ncbi:alpha-ketoglutarate-dependent dioxygenase AlkB family protein [Snuella lapsa]|uniref:Alpha-ketoglutarate-dependent dioxygenase AlkB n=1 Tax=Snuella lapsa TaxID=870481 RepID=A0ABP6YKK1_9FLAO
MELFELGIDHERNLLPKDGIVNYYGKLLNIKQAEYYFDKLLKNTKWRHDTAVIFGKKIITKRKVAWYGDKPFEYTYSKITKQAQSWTKDLLELKTMVESKTGETFNSCLLNLYHSGSEGMSWHSDDEKDLQENGAIASLSLGADRFFVFKHKGTKETVRLYLTSGSLLVMKGSTQAHWLHQLPVTKKVSTPRINLTFRTIVN